MSTEIRTPSEEDREAVGDVMAVSMNFGPSWMRRRQHLLPLQDMRCAFEGDRVVATAGGRAFTQWFGGAELDMLGVWGVATLPEHRRSGNARRLVTELLRAARERGTPLSALYPAVIRPYRGMGYELAGWYITHEVRIDDLPRGAAGPLEIEEYHADGDLDAICACYRRAMAAHNGPIDSQRDWWTTRRLGHFEPEDLHRVVVARGRHGIEAYASFIQEKAEGALDVSFRVVCKHLAATSIAGYASLLEYFRAFGGLGQALRFTGVPADPLSMLLEEQRLNVVWAFRWMLRLLDVPAALQQRGYPPVDGEAVIAVEDALFPQNRGPWRVSAVGGKVEVSRAEGETREVVPIGPLSAMYSGFLSPFDAVRLGLMEADDPAVAVLALLFAGPAPFMIDFF
jgi:predicted acetyltransferase